jgi:hypothetical protein
VKDFLQVAMRHCPDLQTQMMKVVEENISENLTQILPLFNTVMHNALTRKLKLENGEHMI